MRDFEPKILAFACNWCSYAGADLAGVSRIQYPPTTRVIRVMCSGRVSPMFILEALRGGADGDTVNVGDEAPDLPPSGQRTLPTGSIDVRGPMTHTGSFTEQNAKYPYGMQLGSGTRDYIAGLTGEPGCTVQPFYCILIVSKPNGTAACPVIVSRGCR